MEWEIVSDQWPYFIQDPLHYRGRVGGYLFFKDFTVGFEGYRKGTMFVINMYAVDPQFRSGGRIGLEILKKEFNDLGLSLGVTDILPGAYPFWKEMERRQLILILDK